MEKRMEYLKNCDSVVQSDWKKITGMFLIKHLTLIWHLFVPIKDILTQDKVYGRKTSHV